MKLLLSLRRPLSGKTPIRREVLLREIVLLKDQHCSGWILSTILSISRTFTCAGTQYENTAVRLYCSVILLNTSTSILLLVLTVFVLVLPLQHCRHTLIPIARYINKPINHRRLNKLTNQIAENIVRVIYFIHFHLFVLRWRIINIQQKMSPLSKKSTRNAIWLSLMVVCPPRKLTNATFSIATHLLSWNTCWTKQTGQTNYVTLLTH